MPTNPKLIQLTKAELGFQTSVAVRDAILLEKPDDYKELFILSERIRLCNESSNIWTATDLHNADGEAYDGSGRFWNCNSKLCPSCVAKKSRINRNQLREAISNQKLFVGENFHFITFTIPKTQYKLLFVRDLIQLAWSYFRKRKYAKETFKGGCKSEEFTVSSAGFHYHLHLIVRGRYIQFEKLRAEWTECVQAAFEKKTGKKLAIATADGLCVVNVKKIHDLNSAIKEVAKYVTKADSWQKIRTSDLLDICRIKRFPRMFELFGSFRLPSPVSDEEKTDKQSYLDTQSLSDGTSSNRGWRNQLKDLSASEYFAKLHQEIADATIFRKEQLKFHFPAAKFKQLRGDKSFSEENSCLLFRQIESLLKLNTEGKNIEKKDVVYSYENSEYVRKI